MAAIAAVIISSGLGIISGVGILHIFIRALIFALVFFSFGFGLRFLINGFFPELLTLDDESSAQESFDQPGSRINITLDNTGEFAVPELYKAPGDPKELGNIDDLISGIFKPRSAYDEQQPQPGIDRKSEGSYNIDSAFQSSPDQDDFTFQDVAFFEEPKLETAGVEKSKVDNLGFEKPGVEKPGVEKPGAEKPTFTPSFGDDDGVGGLPDLEMFAMSFSGDVRPPQPATPSGGFSGASVPDQAQDEFEPVQPSRYVASKPAPMKGNFDPKQLAQGISTVLSKDK
jgi:hypothetical protein